MPFLWTWRRKLIQFSVGFIPVSGVPQNKYPEVGRHKASMRPSAHTHQVSFHSFSLSDPFPSFSRSLERRGWTKISPDVSRLPPPPTTCCYHAREGPQALAFRGEVTGAQSRDHVTALALATAVPPTLAPGPAP
jgi:hypothetical protein